MYSVIFWKLLHHFHLHFSWRRKKRYIIKCKFLKCFFLNIKMNIHRESLNRKMNSVMAQSVIDIYYYTNITSNSNSFSAMGLLSSRFINQALEWKLFVCAEAKFDRNYIFNWTMFYARWVRPRYRCVPTENYSRVKPLLNARKKKCFIHGLRIASVI